MSLIYHNQDCYNYCGPACIAMAGLFLCAKRGANASIFSEICPPDWQQQNLFTQARITCDQRSSQDPTSPWWSSPDGATRLLNSILQFYGISSVQYEIIAVLPHSVSNYAEHQRARRELLKKMSEAIVNTGAPAMLPMEDRSHWVVVSGIGQTSSGEYEWELTDPVNNAVSHDCRASLPHSTDQTCPVCRDYPFARGWVNASGLDSSYPVVSLGMNWTNHFIAIVPLKTGDNSGEFEPLNLTDIADGSDDVWHSLAGLPVATKRLFPGSAGGESFRVQRLDQPGRGYYLQQIISSISDPKQRLLGMAISPSLDTLAHRALQIGAQESNAILTTELTDKAVHATLQAASSIKLRLQGIEKIPADEIHIEPGYFWKPCSQSPSPFRPFRIVQYQGNTRYITNDGSIYAELSDSRNGM